MSLSRVELHESAEIRAPAADVWALLIDWAGMMRWSLSARKGGALGRLVKCELVGNAGETPRTRRMILDSGAAIEEELFYEDAKNRRIFYRKADNFGTTGYLATCFIDAIDEISCTMHIASWFDFDGDVASGADQYASIYMGIFQGFNDYFSQDRSHRPDLSGFASEGLARSDRRLV